MNWKGLAVSIVLAAVAVAQGTVVETSQPQPQPQPSLVGSVPNQARGPSFSSPPETMAPNGDRIGHYPPYYHPEHTGHGHRR